MENRIKSAAWTGLDRLEPRQLLASISGTVVEDLNSNSLREGRERGIAGVTLFLDQNMNRQFDSFEQSTTSDGNGFYEFTNLPAGEYIVAQLPPTGYSQTSPPRNGYGSFAGDYDLDLHFVGPNLNNRLKAIVQSAAARWEKVLVGDLPDAVDSVLGAVDDMLIDVKAIKRDGRGGVLAFARPTQFRPADSEAPELPFRGEITFDIDDLKDPFLFETAVHELGHALGFTAQLWTRLGLFRQDDFDPRFKGENATREFNQIFGTSFSSAPLEPASAGGGSAFSHWEERLFQGELMSPTTDGVTGEPMSRITVALFQDIGYKVDYRGADPYVAFNDAVPFTEPNTAGGGPVGYSYQVVLENDADTSAGKDFLTRVNQRPTLDKLVAENGQYLINDVVRLRAVGAFDADAGDSVTAVGFFAETNGLEGLQTGGGGDKFIGLDESPDGGFRINANTEALGLGVGNQMFYARPYDELLVIGKPRSFVVNLTDTNRVPRKPADLRLTALSSADVAVQWTDQANNEFGYRLERATDEFFTRNVKRFTLPGDTTSFVDSRLTGGTQYYYRLRSFNVRGTAGFIGPTNIITPNTGEKTIDVDRGNVDEVGTLGNVGEVVSAGGGKGALLGSTLLIRDGGRIDVRPDLSFNGDYFLYARWTDLGFDMDRGVFEITDARGKVQRPIVVDQDEQGAQGGFVYLGKFNFDTRQTAVITFRGIDADQAVNLDAVKFVPGFTV